MTIHQLSDEQCSRWIAEKLEPSPASGGFEEWEYDGFRYYSPRLCWESHDAEAAGIGEWARVDWQPRNMVDDPAMTVLLMESIVRKSDYSRSIEIYYDAFVLNEYGDDGPDSGKITRLEKKSLGRAVAEAFCLANGWKEGEK